MTPEQAIEILEGTKFYASFENGAMLVPLLLDDVDALITLICTAAEAYRQGAQDMREACAKNIADHVPVVTTRYSDFPIKRFTDALADLMIVLADDLRALPIPETKPKDTQT